MAEPYCGLDGISHRCRHFHGCAALIQVCCHLKLPDRLVYFRSAVTDILSFQVWLAGHMRVEILLPQRSTFEGYYSSSHAWTIGDVREEYEKLEKLIEGTVT